MYDIDPDFGYYEETGIPVFKPTMKVFADFSDFISKVEKFGMEKGIVKVIPPKEWVDNLPMLSKDQLKSIKIKNPIMQHVNGTSGLYKLQNIEKQRSYTLPEWRGLCEEPDHQPPAKRGERRKVNSELIIKRHRKKVETKGEGSKGKSTIPDEFENFNHTIDSSDFTPERCQELERLYWKTFTYSTPMYGADMPGSLFDNKTTTWNVAHLDNILNQLKLQIPGVNTAYLYCGMWKATFAWHLEDMDLFSINYIHFGCPKQWYSISQDDHEKFYNLMKDLWPQEYANCKEFLRHKTFHASPALLAQHGIKVNKIVHNQHEFMITFPYGYHSGYNLGYNVAESVNFATESWIPIGRVSNKCKCISDSVGIDVDRLVRHMNGDYDDYEDSLGSLPTPPYVVADSEDEERAVGRMNIVKMKTNTKSKRNVKNEKDEKKSRKRIKDNDSNHPQKRRKVDDSPTCLLCPNTFNDDLIKSIDNQFAHRICATYIPETDIIQSLKDSSKELLVGLNDIPKARKTLKCLYCGSTKGACFQCSFPLCSRSYHGSCSYSAGVLVMDNDSKTDDDDKVNYNFLCKHHRPKRIDIDKLENDSTTLNWGYCLLPGDIIQCQIGNATDIFAGKVEDNLLSEERVVIRPLLDSDELMEVDWKWVRHPFGGKEVMELGNEKKKKIDKSKTTKKIVEKSVTEIPLKESLLQPETRVASQVNLKPDTRSKFISPGDTQSIQDMKFKSSSLSNIAPTPTPAPPPSTPPIRKFSIQSLLSPEYPTKPPSPPQHQLQIKFHFQPDTTQTNPRSERIAESFDDSNILHTAPTPFNTRRVLKSTLTHPNVNFRPLTINKVKIDEETIQLMPGASSDIETIVHEYYKDNNYQIYISERLTDFTHVVPPTVTNFQPLFYDFEMSTLQRDFYYTSPMR